MNWFERLKMRWHMRGSAAAPLTTTAIPTQQHEMLTDAEKFKRDHGYSASTAPMPATPEIEAHNAAVEQEYRDEIDRRKAAFERGEYTPRFMMVRPGHEAPMFLDDQGIQDWILRNPGLIDVNWDLEMSQGPGRRVDVTEDIGKPVLPMPTADDLAQVNEVNRQRRRVEAIEAEVALGPLRISAPDQQAAAKALGLTFAEILDGCGGNVALAHQVAKKAGTLIEDVLTEASHANQPQD